jgi:hypothetical protein
MSTFTRGFVALLLVVFTLPAISHAQATSLAGKWKITWLDNGKPSGVPGTITLTETDYTTLGSLSGKYIADNGEQCTVSGQKSNDSARQLDMKIQCATWRIAITGTIAVDGQQIKGGVIFFRPSGPDLGDYVMDKIVCMLPEGCTN